MDYYLSSDQAKKHILLDFSLFGLFCLFDLSNFQKIQMSVMAFQVTEHICSLALG